MRRVLSALIVACAVSVAGAEVKLPGDAKDCEVELRAFDGGNLVASGTGAAAQPLALAIPQHGKKKGAGLAVAHQPFLVFR